MRDDDPAPAVAKRQDPPVDPDVDMTDPRQRREMRSHGAQTVAVIAAGGMLGAASRHAVALALPTAPSGLPWSTLIVNTTGCLLIGVLMVLIVEERQTHRLARPFLAVGILGGYTTFSTYTVDVQALIDAGRPAVALGYLVGTAVAALLAVYLGVALTRAVPRRHRPATRGGTR